MSIDISAQGDVTIGGDVVGRDKIINNIQNIVQRALTAAEEADQDRALETKILAQGVSVFAQRLQARASEVAEAGKGGPYKGLLEYRLSDAEIFYGRSKAIASVLGNLQRGPLTVLHAESGAGKTSLLQAGVSPRLIAAGHLPIYLRPYNVEPSLALKRAFLPDLSATPLLATAPLRDFLRQVDELIGEPSNLYIFLDQFEEFFMQLEEPARAEFIRELAECLDDEATQVHWVLSMRTEYFGNLANFRPRIRNPFENDFRLNRLTRAEAHEVVVEPAQRRGVTYEAGLVETILDDLGTGVDEVPPPQIQLVCSVLYEELPSGSTQIMRALYEAQGGAGGILRGHLDRVMQRDLPPEQAPIAQRVLEALISADGHRLICSRTKLLVELNGSGQPPIATATLDAVLNQLVDSRLLRVHDLSSSAAQGYETTSGLSYELTHDYLLEQIKVDPAVQARKAAQELLDAETRNFERYGTLLSDDKLAILAPRRKELVVAESANRLLDKSEAALRRRRGILRVGIGLVIFLFIVGIGSGIAAALAYQQRGVAEKGQYAAQTQAAQAATQQKDSETAKQIASEQRATAEVAATIAGGQATQAAGAAATAVSAAATATFREALANAVVEKLYENNGLIPVAVGPSFFTFDGQRLWVTNQNANTVQAINPANGLVMTTYPVDAGPTALAFDGQRLWVTNSLSDTVQALDPDTGRINFTVVVGDEPSALLFAAGRVWVANRSSNSVQAIDPATATAGKAIAVGSLPWALAFDGSRVWVANWAGGTIQPIDPETETPGDEIAVGRGRDPRPWSLLWDGSRLWIANDRDKTVQALDPVTNTPSDPIDVGVRPSGLAFDGRHIWTANFGADTVQVIDPKANRLGATIRVGSAPRDVIFANGRVWVANFRDNAVKVLDLAIGDLSAPMAVDNAPRALASGGNLVWVANQNSNTVQAIDPATGAITRYAVGAGPRALAWDGTRMWVGNGGNGTVQAINPETHTVYRAIQLEANPRALAFDGNRVWALLSNRTLVPIDPEKRVPGKPVVSVAGDPTALTFDGTRLWVTVTSAVSNTVQSVAPTSGQLGPAVKVGERPFALAFDGTWLWVANQDSNDLYAVDPNTNTLVKTVTVGTAPVSLAWDPVSARIWVANFADSTVQSIDPKTNNLGVRIPVGSGPIALAFDGDRVWVANLDSNSVQFIDVGQP
jgi:YVTN family beta-propeller protein